MSDEPNDLEHPATPPPVPLGYRSLRDDRRTTTSMVVQVFAGIGAWIGAVLLVFFVSMASEFRTATVPIASICFAVAGVIGICIRARAKLQWRGFIPGVLIGFGVTCLLPLGILAVVCNNSKF